MKSRDIKAFWDKRARQYKKKQSYSLTNLEEDEKLQQLKVQLEREHVFKLLKLDKSMRVLDLGAGVGAWSALLAEKCKKLVAVEYCAEMLEIARSKAQEESLSNIEFIHQDVLEYTTGNAFDTIFSSGLLLYLSDSQMQKLLPNIKKYSKAGTILFLREPTGIEGRHEIVDEYSQALQTYYNALYRTREEYIALFESIGYSLICDEDMFEQSSPLNKWEETRLRVYSFRYGS